MNKQETLEKISKNIRAEAIRKYGTLTKFCEVKSVNYSYLTTTLSNMKIKGESMSLGRLIDLSIALEVDLNILVS